MRAGDLEREGLSPPDARRQATRRFGNVAVVQDRGYDVRGGGFVETVLQDMRYGLRRLWAQRGFSAIAVLTLAVGVGLTTALFSVIHAAVLRPLPYPNPEQLYDAIVETTSGERVSRTGPSLLDARAWRGARSVIQTGIDSNRRDLIVETGPDAEPARLTVQVISEGFFETLGVSLVLGRSFRDDEMYKTAPGVVLLGHGYWRRHFGGDRSVLGSDVRVGGEPSTIVGVAPPGFYPGVAIWQPLRYGPLWEYLRGTGADTIVRLRPGVTKEGAEAELSVLASQQPDPKGRLRPATVRLESLHEQVVSGTGAMVATLAGSVGAILLIACVNVAGLTLARGATRHRELAVRASLGAGRGRLIRQLLTESAVLAVAGGAVGVLLAWLTLDALVALAPLPLGPNSTPALNLDVLLFSAVVAVLTPLLFGLVPAFRLSRATVSTALSGADRRSGAALSRRGGQWLIGAEVALALLLVTGATLMIQSFSRLVSVDLGFDPGAFIALEAAPVDPNPAVATEYYPALVEAIRRLPEVKAVGSADQSPIGGSRRAGFVRLEGRTDNIRIDQRQVLPGFFEAMGLRLKQGRLPVDADRASPHPLIVINEATARAVFAGAPVVGRQLPVEGSTPEIIGVVGDILQDGARGTTRPNVYWVFTQGSKVSTLVRQTVFVRPVERSQPLAARLRDIAQTIGPRVIVDRVRSGDDYLADNVTVPRRRMILLGLLGGVGLLLTLIGVFSMTAYAVTRRTREIGVRVAFGATAADVIRTVTRDTARPAVLGLVAGLAGAYFVTRVIESLLFQTTPHDPLAFAIAALVLLATTALAAWLPARRAASIDPVKALNTD